MDSAAQGAELEKTVARLREELKKKESTENSQSVCCTLCILYSNAAKGGAEEYCPMHTHPCACVTCM